MEGGEPWFVFMRDDLPETSQSCLCKWYKSVTVKVLNLTLFVWLMLACQSWITAKEQVQDHMQHCWKACASACIAGSWCGTHSSPSFLWRRGILNGTALMPSVPVTLPIAFVNRKEISGRGKNTVLDPYFWILCIWSQILLISKI